MTKIILLTGATDGIGLETARVLAKAGHTLIVHGRSPQKLAQLADELSSFDIQYETYQADLSNLSEVKKLAEDIKTNHDTIDVVINNAGVFSTPKAITSDGLDIRFVVNTIAPFLLVRELKPLLGMQARVVNVSSAAQAPVNLQALQGKVALSDNQAYAQSKLAITMWNNQLASEMGSTGTSFIAVNPGSLLGSKMVKEAYGLAGGDIAIGADILSRAALSEEFNDASGKYYDNDSKRFAPPHKDANNADKCQQLVHEIEIIIKNDD